MTAPPALTAAQARALDEALQRELAVPGLLLMENAGRGAAEEIVRRYGPGGRAVILAGPGNNGGDGWVVARHLVRLGWSVRVEECPARRDDGAAAGIAAGDAATQRAIVVRLAALLAEPRRLALHGIADADGARAAAGRVAADEVVVDALLGTGSKPPLREPMATLVAALTSTPRRACVALDLPSSPQLRADLTLTFAARKRELEEPPLRAAAGDVVVVDLGVPAAAITKLQARAGAG